MGKTTSSQIVLLQSKDARRPHQNTGITLPDKSTSLISELVLKNCIFFQEFIAAEVLKLYGLTKDQSQKTDWQKMLKFGRKKRDRVDHILVGLMLIDRCCGLVSSYLIVSYSLLSEELILATVVPLSVSQVQELHEEEAQWVNYDEDELFVKIQLADSIFDALLKDTVSVLNEIYEKKAKRKASSQLS